MLGCGACRDGEQCDLGRGVEAEPEQEPDRVHVPALADQLEEASEDAAHQAAGLQLVLKCRPVVVAASHPAVDAQDVEQDPQVEDPDHDQEDARHAGPHQSPDALELAVARDHAVDQRLHGQAQ